jgi:hypothetical protein
MTRDKQNKYFEMPNGSSCTHVVLSHDDESHEVFDRMQEKYTENIVMSTHIDEDSVGDIAVFFLQEQLP